MFSKQVCFRAFTLIEVLVVVTIIAALMVFAQMGFGVVSRNAKQTQSLANMRAITQGLLTFASDNKQQLPSFGEDSEFTWDVQILPYMMDEKTDASGAVNLSAYRQSEMKIFRCPLDQRQSESAAGMFPRSYGITGVSINVAGDWSGGIPNREAGEGIRLPQIPKPSKFVMLCRIPRAWELSDNVVGEGAWLANNGPRPSSPESVDWAIFNGKTPYGFADGHVELLPPDAAALVDPHAWSYEQ